MADIENGRCHNEKAPQDSPPLFQHGKLVIQMHHIGWLVSGVFTIAATVISFWLMHRHLRWYTDRKEQRYIIRILLMVPLYAIVSTASYLFWNHSTPLLLVRDCYECIVLTSFFYLLLLYLSPRTDEQQEIFRKHGLSHYNDRLRTANGEPPRKWMFPLGTIKARPQDGLYFLQMMKWGVLQYCVIRPITTLASVILDYAGLYCEDSWSPGWGHIYITIIVSISVSVSMYCLIQLYVCVSSLLAPQKPLLKMFAIKAVVFLTFWQATFLSLLATFGFIKDTQYMTAENINIGIGAIAETVEMTLFAILHIKAFSYKPYVISSQPTNALRALLHAFNFNETYRELKSGTVYMWHRVRGRETDVLARRQAVLEGVFGKSRIEIQGGLPTSSSNEKERRDGKAKAPLTVEVAVEQMVHTEPERVWLGVGDNSNYTVGRHSQRLEEKDSEVNKESTRRNRNRNPPRVKPPHAGYDLLDAPSTQPDHTSTAPYAERPWWKNVYNRLSQTDPLSGPELDPNEPRNPHTRRAAARHLSEVDLATELYDDPPPPSSIRMYQEKKSKHSRSRTSQPNPSPVPPSAIPHPPLTQRPQVVTTHLLPTPAFRTSTPSFPSNSDRTSRVDSFLAGVFTRSPISDTSQSTDALSAGATSTQSHRTQVQLTLGPAVVPNEQPRAVQRKPVRYYPPPAPIAIPLSTRIEEEPMGSQGQYSGDTRREGHSRRSTEGFVDRTRGIGTERVSMNAQHSSSTSTPTSPPPRRHGPRRDQIVLPALLAPAVTSPQPPGLLSLASQISPPASVPLAMPSVPNHTRDTSSGHAPSGGHRWLRRSKRVDSKRHNTSRSEVQHLAPASSAERDSRR